MTHGSLFSGICGFDLAAEWAGIENVWQVENEKYCNKLSKLRFPNTVKYGDIKKTKNLPYVDIISGGFPCQPFSVAGKRKGKEDDRALWPEMLRIIKECKPAWVIGENVTGIINMELDAVLSDLESEGFETQTFIIPACGLNARHRRNRVWILAYSDNNRERVREQITANSNGARCESPQKTKRNNTNEKRDIPQEEQQRNNKQYRAGIHGVLPDTNSNGIKKSSEVDKTGFVNEKIRARIIPNINDKGRAQQRESEQSKKEHTGIKCDTWRQTQPGMGRAVHGLSGRLDGYFRQSDKFGIFEAINEIPPLTEVKENRVSRISGSGNAVVPQIPFIFFKIIVEINKIQNNGYKN